MADGNIAAMREAIGKALWCLNWMDENTDDKSIKDHLAKPIELLTAALAAPPRNCDVGTAEEQTERFESFCQSNMQFYQDMFGHDDEGRLDGWDCRKDCPIGQMIDIGEAVADHCQLAWAQMPYEAEGGEEQCTR